MGSGVGASAVTTRSSMHGPRRLGVERGVGRLCFPDAAPIKRAAARTGGIVSDQLVSDQNASGHDRRGRYGIGIGRCLLVGARFARISCPSGRRASATEDGANVFSKRDRRCASTGPVLAPAAVTTGHGSGDEAVRGISTGKLNALLRVHTRPIDVVVYHGSRARPGFEGGFPLRCLQRLSRPHIATRLCRWRDNRSTRGASIPVLSY